MDLLAKRHFEDFMFVGGLLANFFAILSVSDLCCHISNKITVKIFSPEIQKATIQLCLQLDEQQDTI